MLVSLPPTHSHQFLVFISYINAIIHRLASLPTHHPLRERQVRVACLHNLQLVPVHGQPSPAATKVPVRVRSELLPESLESAQVAVDQGRHLPRGFPPPVGLDAVPVEVMVPDLRRIVEQSLILACSRKKRNKVISWNPSYMAA